MIISWPNNIFTCKQGSHPSLISPNWETFDMSPQLTSQGVVLATTAAMAVSGMVILLALRLHHKTLPSSSDSLFHPSPDVVLLRPCISSSDKKMGGNNSKKKKKKNKRVRFADEAADPSSSSSSYPDSSSTTTNTNKKKENKSRGDLKVGGMPANRMALYKGMLRDRVIQRMAYSY